MSKRAPLPKVIELAPPSTRPKLPQCVANVSDHTADWHRRRPDKAHRGGPERCQLNASIQFGGSQLCRRHAMQEALALLLDKP